MMPPEKKLIVKTAPFPAGAKVRYNGSRRLYAGFNPVPVLAQGTEVLVVETAGTYSVYQQEAEGRRYPMVITLDEKPDWQLVP